MCINNSVWEHTLDIPQNQPQDIGLRLGLRLIKGVKESSALKLIDSRSKRKLVSVQDAKSRHLMHQDELMKLINANAFHEFDDNRRHAYWQSLEMDSGLENKIDSEIERDADSNSEFNVASQECHQTPIGQHHNTVIAPLSPLETLMADYRSARGVSLQYHPMQLLRHTEPFSRLSLIHI